jgi:hypothetical protein
VPARDVLVWLSNGVRAAGLDVPRQASTVFIQSLAGRDGDPLVRNATVFVSSDVRKLLADSTRGAPSGSAGQVRSVAVAV